ncbi:hypothetical protein BDV12DRAFT_167628 [Aspergillus spectabilis]
MTFDKQNNGHIAKPFTPTLSAAFNRANKSPLTPKLANPPTVRAPKRLASDHPATTPARQGIEPTYLNANITPRSGSRSSRRDGPILSPGSTPVHSPQSSFVQPSPANGPNTRVYRTDRSPVRMGGKLEPSRTARAKTLTADLNTVARPHSSTDFSAASPMFFHASDVRSISGSSDADTRSRVSGKSASPATFVYANGQEESQASVEDTSRRRSSGLSRPAIVTKPTASPRLKSPQLGAATLRFSDSIPSQSMPHLDDSPELRSPIHSPPLSTVRPVPIISHTKSSSLDTGRGTPFRETYAESLRPSPILISTLDSQVEDTNVANIIPALRPRIFSNGSTASLDSQTPDSQYDGMQSPVKSDHAGSSGPVLNARVERKILDLEISNSSLLAINKTLEREMRKQNAELRRFRRLSRAGRLSVAPSRSVSNTLSITSEIDEGGSELSSNQSHDDISEMSDEESMLDESSLEPDSIADDDSRQRNKDEKRFLIDLAKHQELLADSQKMNQSLKRCLGWTEELIKEAKKALEYNVHVNDIQLGGRVLSPDEYQDGEAGKGLLAVVSPETELPSLDLPDIALPDSDDDDLSSS